MIRFVNIYKQLQMLTGKEPITVQWWNWVIHIDDISNIDNET